jgi:hypothetical protein
MEKVSERESLKVTEPERESEEERMKEGGREGGREGEADSWESSRVCVSCPLRHEGV